MLHVQRPTPFSKSSRVSRGCSSGNLSRVLFGKTIFTIFDEPTRAARSRFYAERPVRERRGGWGDPMQTIKTRIRRQRGRIGSEWLPGLIFVGRGARESAAIRDHRAIDPLVRSESGLDLICGMTFYPPCVVWLC